MNPTAFTTGTVAPGSIRRANERHRSGGFTLVELLAVVTMIGILAALAIVGYRRYLSSSRTAEAKDIIGAIHVAQESYRAETLGYLDCSTSPTTWYPGTPDARKRHWLQPGHTDYTCWQTLNVAVDSPTMFGFTVVAGSPGDTPPDFPTATDPTWPNPTTAPWYVVTAAGDDDANGTFSYFLSSSFAPSEIYVENESE